MTIQPISGASLALYLTPDDLRQRGLHAQEMTARNTLDLAREALLQAGLSLHEPMEIEYYPDKTGLLVFVRMLSPRPTVWLLPDFESLVSASHALHTNESDAVLYRWEDRLWLALENDCPQLAEFADRTEDDLYIRARLAEYGTPLLTGRVFSTLHDHF